ncbi:hypothetical protein HGB07_04545 [Candidatus Roizmanbacteria bacterium]|nr:hypothetical protein [Candidatus Roizmanbacteria bacterium]
MFYGLITADVLMALVIGLKFRSLPPQIPLFYSQAWGEDQLTDIWFIFILPLLLHLFIFLNLFLINRYFPTHALMKDISRVISWFFIVAFTVIFLRLIFLIS